MESICHHFTFKTLYDNRFQWQQLAKLPNPHNTQVFVIARADKSGVAEIQGKKTQTTQEKKI